MKNFKAIIGICVLLSGCTSIKPDTIGETVTQFDIYCTSEYCKDARQYLIDRKVIRNESKEPDDNDLMKSGKKFLEDFKADTTETELDEDCMKTAQKIIDDRYVGCKKNENSPEVGTEFLENHVSPYFKEKGTVRLTYKGKKYKKRPMYKSDRSRQCAIEMFNQVRHFTKICKTNFWKTHKQTASVLKEMADDGIIATGLVRSATAFDGSLTPYDSLNITYKNHYDPEIILAANPIMFHDIVEEEYDGYYTIGLDEATPEKIEQIKQNQIKRGFSFLKLLRTILFIKKMVK